MGQDPPIPMPRGPEQPWPLPATLPGHPARAWTVGTCATAGGHRVCTQHCCKAESRPIHPRPKTVPTLPLPGLLGGATYLEATSRNLVLWSQAGAHARVCPSEPSGRAVGVSQQQFLSLKERGRGSSPIPVWAPLLIMGEDSVELGASERHGSQGLARHLSHSFSSTIVARLESSSVCPTLSAAAPQARPCATAKPLEMGQGLAARGARQVLSLGVLGLGVLSGTPSWSLQ